MRKNVAILFFPAVCLALSFFAGQDVRAGSSGPLEIGMQAGFRQDQVDWNIGGNLGGQDVDVFSELEWDDLDIWQLGISGKAWLFSSTQTVRPYINGTLNYGWITDGSVRDSDYNGNNRTMESFRMLAATDDDNVFDVSIGLGFEKRVFQKLTVGFSGGYSYHEQNLRLTDGHQIIPVNQPISGLDSTYESKWYGPFAGIDLALQPLPQFSLLGSVQYHWADYEAEADWNLRSDLAHPVSFRHEAEKGGGVFGTLKGRYLFSNGLMLDLAFDYISLSAKDGIDQTILADGSSIFVKLNEVNWQSSAITLGFSYSF